MADILELVMDPETGAQPKMEPVFRLDLPNNNACQTESLRFR